MRQRYKGHLRFSMVLIPVKVYNGEETQDKVKFNQFHVGCGGLVGKKDYCKSCDATLTGDQIYKGYKIDDDHIIEISDSDMENVKLESTKVIDILGFVDPSEISVMYYEKPLLIGPDGKIGEQTYGMFVAAIKQSGKVAIGKIVLSSGREDQVAISVVNDALVMCVIRYKDEVRSVAEIPNISNVQTAVKEQVELAVGLINDMTFKFDQLSVVNEYNAKLKELIDLKAQGKLVTVEKQEQEQKQSSGIDIMAMLKASKAQVIKPNEGSEMKVTKVVKTTTTTTVKSDKKKQKVTA